MEKENQSRTNRQSSYPSPASKRFPDIVFAISSKKVEFRVVFGNAERFYEEVNAFPLEHELGVSGGNCPNHYRARSPNNYSTIIKRSAQNSGMPKNNYLVRRSN